MKFKHIQSRISLYMVLLVVFSLIASWITMFIYFNNTLKDNLLNQHSELVNKITDSIDSNINYVKEYANTITYTENISQYLSDFYKTDGFKKFSTQNKLSTIISDYVLCGKDIIYNIYATDKTGTIEMSLAGKHSQDLKEDWFRSTIENPDFNDGFTDIHAATSRYEHQSHSDTIAYVKKIHNIRGETLGYMVLEMDLDKIFSLMNSGTDNNQGYYLMDNNSNILYQKSNYDYPLNLDKLDLSLPQQKIGDTYYIIRHISYLDKYIVSTIPSFELSASLADNTAFMIFILTISTVFAMILAMILARTITQPLRSLQKGMSKMVKSNFDYVLPVTGRDEISEITQIFNSMQLEIKKLLADNKDYGEMRLKYFMSKIDQHFLYNTLNCVIYLARKKEVDSIIPLTKALISILKTNISLGEKEIKIREEIDYLKNYFEILKYRYNNMIQLKIDVPEELMDLYIQPMILYPLVENAVFHGIAPTGREGTVTVSAVRNGQFIRFCTEDNGIGIPPDKLESIRTYLNPDSKATAYGSIGMKNANDRLSLFYKSCSLIQIESLENQGTKIWFEIYENELK